MSRTRFCSSCRRITPLVATATLLFISAVVALADEIDWDKARELRRKQQAGQQLSADEQRELRRAIEVRRQQPPSRPGDRGQRQEGKPSLGLTPVTDFASDETYKGFSGGLYGEGQNEPPREHLAAALDAAGSIQPLDAEGRPDPNGKIVMISNGMSNTTGEFRTFMQLAEQNDEINPQLAIVDAAQGGQEASDWANPQGRHRQERPDPWDVQRRRLQAAGVTAEQVQVVWMKQARRNPASLGEFPEHARQLQQNQGDILRRLKRTFPNLKLAFLSSRIYAGYAATPLNPEPYAYESAWANQWLIRDQIAGDPELNYDASDGGVEAPVILWGPYLWADGVAGRAADDLVYRREDLAGDGTHPSESGRRKVAQQLMEFFTTHPSARPWFAADGGR